jgi:hypothetical protein
VAKQNIKQMMEEALGEGHAAQGGTPAAAAGATATAVASVKPAPVAKPPRPQVIPPGKDGVKLVAPGSAPIGPRMAGAHACEAIHADKSNLMTAHGRTSLRGAFLAHATLSAITAEGQESPEVLKVNELVLTGLRFLSPVPLRPGTVRFLRTTGSDDAKLSSAVRVVSTKVRPDGQFDVTAEFY